VHFYQDIAVFGAGAAGAVFCDTLTSVKCERVSGRASVCSPNSCGVRLYLRLPFHSLKSNGWMDNTACSKSSPVLYDVGEMEWRVVHYQGTNSLWNEQCSILTSRLPLLSKFGIFLHYLPLFDNKYYLNYDKLN